MLAYEDAAAAIDWLSRVFGFEERLRLADDGTVTHAELGLGGEIVMLATPTPDYEAPNRHRESCEAARRWSEAPYVIDGVLVFVDDVDAHFERARAGGATILSEPEDAAPDRREYRAEDLEGHRWMFAQVASS
jgi:uncharacterized glyoxalase superfamily protein PhnB